MTMMRIPPLMASAASLNPGECGRIEWFAETRKLVGVRRYLPVNQYTTSNKEQNIDGRDNE